MWERNLIVSQTAPSSLQLSLCSNQLADQLLASIEEKPWSPYLSSLQVAELYDSIAVQPIASDVPVEPPDWVSVGSLVVGSMD